MKSLESMLKKYRDEVRSTYFHGWVREKRQNYPSGSTDNPWRCECQLLQICPPPTLLKVVRSDLQWSMLLDWISIFPFLTSSFITTSCTWLMIQYQPISTRLDPILFWSLPYSWHFDSSIQAILWSDPDLVVQNKKLCHWSHLYFRWSHLYFIYYWASQVCLAGTEAGLMVFLLFFTPWRFRAV